MYQHTAAAEPLDPRASIVFCCDFDGGDDDFTDFTTNGNFDGFFLGGTLRQEEKAILMGNMILTCAIAVLLGKMRFETIGFRGQPPK